jgi:hypothetical protein
MVAFAASPSRRIVPGHRKMARIARPDRDKPILIPRTSPRYNSGRGEQSAQAGTCSSSGLTAYQAQNLLSWQLLYLGLNFVFPGKISGCIQMQSVSGKSP